MRPVVSSFVSSPRPLRPQTVHPTPLSRVADLVGAPAPAAGVDVTGVTLNSRAVQPGDLYAALPGSNAHGAAYAADAVAAGAVAVLTDPAGAAVLDLEASGPGDQRVRVTFRASSSTTPARCSARSPRWSTAREACRSPSSG